MKSDERAQLYTLEGLAAAAILIALLLYILQSVSVVTPQTETTMELKLQQKAADTLICLDIEDELGHNKLKDSILWWGGDGANYPVSDLSPNLVDPSINDEDYYEIAELNEDIENYLPSDVLFNLDIYYFDSTNPDPVPVHLIKHGNPNDNSVMVKKLVTINLDDVDVNVLPVLSNSFWKGYTRYPQLVEVRLTAWYI